MRRQKEQYPQIELVLVMAYLNDRRDASGYDRTIYPPLETVPPRFAIARRNEWMLRQADYVVTYITHGWGGAAQYAEKARRQGKTVLNLAQNDPVRDNA